MRPSEETRPGHPPAEPVDHHMTQAFGLELEVMHWTGGAGGPPRDSGPDVRRSSGEVVVAMHGFLDHGWAWDTFVPWLGDDVHLITFSARGHGGSEWAESYLWSEFVADMAKVVENEAGGPAHVMGHSWGGHVCTELAVLAPELVRSVINIDGFVPGPRPEPPTIVERTAATLSRAGDRKPMRPRSTMGELVERRRQLTPRVPDPAIVSFVEHGAVEASDGWRWRIDPLLLGPRPWETTRSHPIEILPYVRQLKVPLLLVTGGAVEGPDLTPDRSEAFVAAHEDHVRHVHVPDAGHYVHLEQPEQVAEAVRSHLAR